MGKLISKWKRFIPYLLSIFSFIVELIVIDIFEIIMHLMKDVICKKIENIQNAIFVHYIIKRVKIVSNNINLNFEYSYIIIL